MKILPAFVFTFFVCLCHGQVMFQKTYGGGSGNSVQETNDGGYVITGETGSVSSGWSGVYIIRLNQIGDVLWAKTQEASYANMGYAVHQTADGGFIIGGVCFYAGPFNIGDLCLIKLDHNGNIEW